MIGILVGGPEDVKYKNQLLFSYYLMMIFDLSLRMRLARAEVRTRKAGSLMPEAGSGPSEGVRRFPDKKRLTPFAFHRLSPLASSRPFSRSEARMASDVTKRAIEREKRIRNAIVLLEGILRRSEARVSFDLQKGIQKVVEGFKTNPQRIQMLTLRELSDALGPSQMTFSNHTDELLRGVEEAGNILSPNESELRTRLLRAVTKKMSS